MDLPTILVVAVALALDCFAVSLAACPGGGRRVRNAATIAFSFAIFQAGMPVLGWFAGRSVLGPVSALGPWVAFALLAIVGVRMVRGGLSARPTEGPACLGTGHLLLLSLATSLDALAVGISLALLQAGILVPCLVIGLTTFAITLLGAMLGGVAVERWGKPVEVLGGLVLVGIGVRILVLPLTG
ncbi:MAG TPA: manganese efflux pump MntP family protein [Methanomicrobiales archaeon]|nr:manganese efflux pump MntP family protein [Methanomicrobiales archaeon]